MLKRTCIVAAAVAGLLTAGGSAFASTCSSHHHIGGSCKPSVSDNVPLINVSDVEPLINVSDINISDIDVNLLDLVGSDEDCCSTTAAHGLF